MKLVTFVFALSLTICCCACSGNQPVSQPAMDSGIAGLEWPQDTLLPGEELDASGHVIGDHNDWLTDQIRTSSGINSDSEFVFGADTFDECGNVADLGQGAALTPAGSELACAVYRLTMGGAQPGAVSADVNLHLGSGGLSTYWLGVADYGSNRWELHGPYSDSQVRVGLSATNDYTSTLGNTFIAVIAYDGAAIDVVGLGASPRAGESVAPPVPSAFAATAVAGGLLLEWTGVIASDLAGYQIYYSLSPFTDASDNGVQPVGYLEGNTRHLLRAPAGRLVWVAVAAVDIDGNVSALSPVLSEFTLNGAPPQLVVTTSVLGGETGVVATLTASGAQSYDFDLDGDGDFELTGNVTGTAQVITDQPGIIRPAVRGTGASGSAIAFGSVSLLIAGNPPPLAVLTAADNQLVLGDTASIETTLDAVSSSDPLGEALTFAFDPEGDGSYIDTGATASFAASYSYSGVYQARVRVTDSEGNAGYDSKVITVRRFRTQTLSGDGDYPSMAIINGTPAVAFFSNDNLIYRRSYDAEGREWAPSETAHDAVSVLNRSCSLVEVGGLPAIAYFDDNADDVMYVLATVPTGEDWNPPFVIDATANTLRGLSMALVNGNPAIAFNDNVTDRLRFARSTASNGYPQATWTTINVSANPDIGVRPSLAVINGNPAISSLRAVSMQGNRLGYVRANDANGAAWGTAFIINDPVNGDQDGLESSLLEVAGHPAIAFTQFNGSQGDVRYVRATTDNGATAAEWGSFIPVSVNNEDHGDAVALKLVGGKPAVVFWDQTNNGVRYVRSTTLAGTTASAWPTTSAFVHGSDVGHYSVDLVAAGSLPIVAFYAGSLDLAVPELE